MEKTLAEQHDIQLLNRLQEAVASQILDIEKSRVFCRPGLYL